MAKRSVLSGATQTLRLWGDDRPRQAPLIRRGADCRVALQASQRASHLPRTANIPGRGTRTGEKQASAAGSIFTSFVFSCCAALVASAGESDNRGDV